MADFRWKCGRLESISDSRRPLSGRDARSAANRYQLLLGALLLLHASFLFFGASQHSPVYDEVGHLPAGISHWRLGTFELYAANPPLVRMVAAVPALFTVADVDWRQHDAREAPWAEFYVGLRMLERHPSEFFQALMYARWACIPFSLLGAYICWLWARMLFGDAAGLLAATLWCFSPNIIAHGQLITPDVGATALGAAAHFAFWRWLRQPNWPNTATAAVVLGLAQLTKSTWILLFGLWPLIWLVWQSAYVRQYSFRHWIRQANRLGFILVGALLMLNAGYGLQGSFKPLGQYTFVSQALGGAQSTESNCDMLSNRFSGSRMANIPVPLPEDYVRGIDFVKSIYEEKMWSYLGGEWREGGWWYFYLYALAIKVPLGTWLLVLLAAICSFCRASYRATWRDEMSLIAPALAVLLLVSSQTGYNHHLRYVLAMFPYLFIWVSKVAKLIELRQWWVASLAGPALLWSVASSLLVYPHSLAYFNELAGGPRGGHYHLGGTVFSSNIDWGQDLFKLKRWLDHHPEARPLRLAVSGLVDPRLVGIHYSGFPKIARGDDEVAVQRNLAQFQAGWYGISVNLLHSRSQQYGYLLRCEPIARIGYSIYVYHLTDKMLTDLQEELGRQIGAARPRAATKMSAHPG